MKTVSLFALVSSFITPTLLSETQPDIIFILTDDQRRDSLSIYGNELIETPNLTALAEKSVVFDNASVTSSICTPSRASYFLGQYERRHSINFNSGTSMAPQAWAQSYPIQLKNNGYFTGYIGKNHVPIGANGYETGLMDSSFDFWYAGHGHIKFYPKDIHGIFKQAKDHTQIEIIREATGSFLGKNTFIAGAKSFLKSRPADQPFCLTICLNVPHGASTRSMEMRPTDPELYKGKYRDLIDSIPLPLNYIEKKDITTPKLPADILYTQFRQSNYIGVDTPETLRELILRQYQTITGIDLMVGDIVDALEDSGDLENTIIIFTSDHGLMLGEHGLGGKALNYEPTLAVPLVIHDPRLPAARQGKRSDALVQSIDIAPTILRMADITPPAEMQGADLTPLLEGTGTRVREFAFAENLWSNVFGNPRIESIRDLRYKYIRTFENTRKPWVEKMKPENKASLYTVTQEMRDMYTHSLTSTILGEEPVFEELYDLTNDPGETTNLIDSPKHTKQLAHLRAQCQAHVTLARGDFSQPPAVLPLRIGSKPR